MFLDRVHKKAMSKNIHKGTELNNVKETWGKNERSKTKDPVTSNEGLERIIKEESSEYGSANKKKDY